METLRAHGRGRRPAERRRPALPADGAATSTASSPSRPPATWSSRAASSRTATPSRAACPPAGAEAKGGADGESMRRRPTYDAPRHRHRRQSLRGLRLDADARAVTGREVLDTRQGSCRAADSGDRAALDARTGFATSAPSPYRSARAPSPASGSASPRRAAWRWR